MRQYRAIHVLGMSWSACKASTPGASATAVSVAHMTKYQAPRTPSHPDKRSATMQAGSVITTTAMP